MKTKSIFTDEIRKHLMYILGVVIVSLCSLVNGQAGNLINITSVKVSKDYPASFVLELERNDIVTVEYRKNSGNADLQQLQVRIIDLNQQEEEVIATFDRSGRDFLAAYDGTYRIDFIYNGKGSGIFKERSLDLAVKVDIDGYDGMKEGESKEVLQATNVVIEEGENSALKVVYYLTKGDKITVSSTDKKASFLKLNITQQPKILSIKGSTVIDIESDGTYTFNFYLDEDDDEGSLLNLKELLSRDDVLFRDLSIFREKAVDYAAMAKSNANSPTSANSSSTDNSDNASEESIEEANPALDIARLIAEGNKSSEEISLVIAETMKEMQEQLNKKNVITEITSIPNDIELRLEPELNFAANNAHRKCEIITLQPTDFDIWFYWVGVGENAQEAFDEHNEEIRRVYKKEFADAAAEYIYSKFGGNTTSRKNPSYPDENRYGQYLNEDAEYAIVDTDNMLKFIAGEKYSKLNQPARNATYITADNGISGKPSGDDGEMYFCACNNNKATPVNVYFKFFAIDVFQQEN